MNDRKNYEVLANLNVLIVNKDVTKENDKDAKQSINAFRSTQDQ